MRLVLITSTLVVGSGAAMAEAPTVNNFPASQSANNPATFSTAAQSAASKWRRALSNIREDALRLQAADGGSLTPTDRTSLQQRLEVANQRPATFSQPPVAAHASSAISRRASAHRPNLATSR